MKKILFAAALSILVMFSASAQIVNGNFEVVTNTGTNFDVKVKTYLNEGSALLGNASLRFKFNTANLAFPENPQAGVDYEFHGLNSSDVSVTKSENNIIAINIFDTVGTEVSSNARDIVTIKFTTLNPAGTADMSWVVLELFSPSSPTPWTLGAWEYENSVLPVELTTLGAAVKSNVVTINWETATEINNSGFDVERSGDKKSWNAVGFVKGSGQSNSTKKYSFEDKVTEGAGKLYYRLKQIDNDGTFKYSEVLEVNLTPEEFVLHQNYPNPFNPSTTIKFSLPVESRVKLTVFNMLGEQVAELVNGVKTAGIHEINFNAGSFASGTYIYSIEMKDISSGKVNQMVKKMTLLK